MKNKYQLYLMILGVSLLICITAYASYAFIGAPNVAGMTNVNTTINPNGSDISLTFGGATSLSLSITESSLSSQNASNSYTNYIEQSATSTVTLQAPSTYQNGATCNYTISYIPAMKYTPSSTIGSLHELTILGSNGQDTVTEKVLDNVDTTIQLFSGTISTTSSNRNVTKSWTFKLRFYNLNINQVEVIGKSPSGKIHYEAGTCEVN